MLVVSARPLESPHGPCVVELGAKLNERGDAGKREDLSRLAVFHLPSWTRESDLLREVLLLRVVHCLTFLRAEAPDLVHVLLNLPTA